MDSRFYGHSPQSLYLIAGRVRVGTQFLQGNNFYDSPTFNEVIKALSESKKITLIKKKENAIKYAFSLTTSMDVFDENFKDFCPILRPVIFKAHFINSNELKKHINEINQIEKGYSFERDEKDTILNNLFLLKFLIIKGNEYPPVKIQETLLNSSAKEFLESYVEEPSARKVCRGCVVL